MIAAFPNSKPADRFRRFKDSQQKHPGTLWRAASDYGLSSGGIGSFSSILRISFGACFRKRRFMSGANSARRSVIASERRQQSDSWCHRKFGHAVGNSCFVANWRTKRPGTRTYWPNPGHTLSVRKKVCAKPRRSPGRKVSTNPRVATMLDGGSLVGPDCEFLCRQVPHAKSRTPICCRDRVKIAFLGSPFSYPQISSVRFSCP